MNPVAVYFTVPFQPLTAGPRCLAKYPAAGGQIGLLHFGPLVKLINWILILFTMMALFPLYAHQYGGMYAMRSIMCSKSNVNTTPKMVRGDCNFSLYSPD